jgi:large subunit ribosomal protein L23
MAFNIFKKSASAADAPTRRKEEVKKPEEAKKAVLSTPAKKEKRKISSFALSLPHITEKAAMLGAQNQYVFKVVPGATKYGVRDSVQAQYGVTVAKVRMITIASKSIRVGRTMGKRPGYKKAVVTLQEGHTIEMGA